MEKIYSIIPKRSIVILFACVSGLILIVLAGIVPQQVRVAGLENRIANLQFQIDEQKKLQPYYKLLKVDPQVSKSRVLPFPQRSPLPRNSIDTIPEVIRAEAQKANIDMVAASPDLNTLGRDNRFVLINTVLKGEFSNLRRFLIGLGSVPSLESIEEIRVRQNEDTMEFRLKIWLAVA